MKVVVWKPAPEDAALWRKLGLIKTFTRKENVSIIRIYCNTIGKNIKTILKILKEDAKSSVFIQWPHCPTPYCTKNQIYISSCCDIRTLFVSSKDY